MKTRDNVKINRLLLHSAAFSAIKPKSIFVYLHILDRRQSNSDYNVTLTYVEAESLWGMSPSRFALAITDLVDKGLIDVASPVTGIGVGPTKYIISYRWVYYGTNMFEPPTWNKKVSHRFASGAKNPNSHGCDVDDYTDGFTEDIKTIVIERDHGQCQQCHRTKRPIVHHIDFKKDNHELDNLILLCSRCHIKTHLQHNSSIL